MLVPSYIPLINNKEANSVFKVVKSGWISQGKKVKEFEKKIQQFLNCKNVIAVNNGTSALHAVLLSLNLKKNDEVIVPTLSYISAVNAIIYVGAKPVLCDSDPITYVTNINYIKKKITKKTKAVITVDLKGLPVDYDEIAKFLKKKNICFISDWAEAFGARYKSKKVGSTNADFHTFSFFANKAVTTGEGGAIICKKKQFFEKIRKIRNQGQIRRFEHEHLGNNFRMTDIQAAIGLEQLKKINFIFKNKIKIANNYQKAFDKFRFVKNPVLPNYVTQHSWYLYSISVKEKYRNKLVKFLSKKGIETRLSFKPVHYQLFHKKIFKKEKFRNAEKAFRTFIDIPIYPLLNNKNQNYVINNIKKFFKNA